MPLSHCTALLAASFALPYLLSSGHAAAQAVEGGLPRGMGGVVRP